MTICVIESIVKKKLEKGERITLRLIFSFGIKTGRLIGISRGENGVTLEWDNVIWQDRGFSGTQVNAHRVTREELENASFKKHEDVWMLSIRDKHKLQEP